MKITNLKISNIASFKYVENIDEATNIDFENDLNIFIGENGSGKSTFLEVITFVLRKVVFLPYSIQYQESQIPTLTPQVRVGTILLQEQNTIGAFKLDKNWNYEHENQMIKVSLGLGDVDKKNIDNIKNNFQKLYSTAEKFSNYRPEPIGDHSNELTMIIRVNRDANQFALEHISDDGAYSYLKDYYLFNHLIDLYNLFSDEADKIEKLGESFAVLGGYRNYSSISNTVSLSTEASSQIRGIRQGEHNKSLRTFDGGEPQIFNMVRVTVANEHVQILRKSGLAEADKYESPVLKRINEKLRLINLKCRLKFLDINSWSYSFDFIDTLRDRTVTNIDDLSAGQKSLLQLIFEAYGRDRYEGGLVIIDEPEIHLHFQFQSAYLKIMNELNIASSNQYIVVTHSDSLISSQTINTVSRLIRNYRGDTEVYQPTEIDHTKKQLIKILDNNRSTYALFARKVVLVEGDTDRYFFQNIIEKKYESEFSSTAVLDMGGKTNYSSWKALFELYGIKVFFIGDFDNIFSLPLDSGAPLVEKGLEYTSRVGAIQNRFYNLSNSEKLRIQNSYRMFVESSKIPDSIDYEKWLSLYSAIKGIKLTPSDYVNEVKESIDELDSKIENLYSKGVFILKRGAVEMYSGTSSHDIESMVEFCDAHLNEWLNGGSPESREVSEILSVIFS